MARGSSRFTLISTLRDDPLSRDTSITFRPAEKQVQLSQNNNRISNAFGSQFKQRKRPVWTVVFIGFTDIYNTSVSAGGKQSFVHFPCFYVVSHHTTFPKRKGHSSEVTALPVSVQ